ncbi:hypothetical protein UFOVP796_18 [uncultured Caudovirales phage]|uniref:Uncharacterized protein n=1 Tax=uncultured Caudovirales phage TaxID=2100421 RepID=A0A6J5NXC5_9CAUD|nr:hypothetical protein UFOVP796_18 [uncultured Caudovirales phage]
MTQWTPEWQLQINGVDYTNITLSTLTIVSGRTDIYSQPRAGYASIEILNLNLTPITIDVNDGLSIKVKNSSGTYVDIFGGNVTDSSVEVSSTGTGGINETIRVTALGALSKLPKTLTDGVLSKDFDGNQIYTILSETLFNTWAEVPAATTWATYTPTTTWANAENSGLGDIDRPGDYELMARSSDATDMYSLVSALATSGLGYLYEDAQGRIGYADATHRTQYLAANGYTSVSGNHALSRGIRTIRRLGDLRNKVTIQWRSGDTTALSQQSIDQYGSQADIIATTLHNSADATAQANFYLGIRAWPQDVFESITFTLGNSELDDSDRDALLNVFMGLALDITDLPANMVNGRFQGFVEGWTFRAGYNRLDLTLNVSPTAFSLQSMQWDDVSVAETWNTLSNTLTWNQAIIVA